MKKLFLLALVCAACLVGISCACAEHVTLDGVVYFVRDDYVSITSYVEGAEEAIIHHEVEGKPLQLKWASSRFNDTIRKLTLAEGIEELPENALSYWDALETLVLPASLRRIGDGALKKCPLLREVIIPEGTVSIGAGAFKDCEAVERVVLPGTLESIGQGAFGDSEKLTAFILNPGSATFREIEGALYDHQGTLLRFPPGRGGEITLPEGTTGISSHAFSTSHGITSLRIPEGVQAFHAPGLNSCCTLERIWLPASLTHMDLHTLPPKSDLVIEVSPENTSIFLRDGALCGGEDQLLIYYPKGRNEALVFPEGIRGMAQFAFRYDDRLTSVVLPEGMEDVPLLAFADCVNLRSVTLPDSMQSLYGYTFSGCTSLSEINLPSDLTTIGSHVFGQCTSLTSLEIPPSVTSIDPTAFDNYTNPEALRIIAEEDSYAAAYARAYYIGLNDEDAVLYGILGAPDVAEPQRLFSLPGGIYYGVEQELVAQWPQGTTVRILRKTEDTIYDDVVWTWLCVEMDGTRGWIREESVYLPSEVPDLYRPLSVQIKKGKVTLRAEPYGEAEELLTLSADEEAYPVLGLAGAWYQVEARDRQGYLPVASVTVTSLDAPEGKTLGVVANPDPHERLNLRAKPSARAESLGRFYSGAQVEILSREGDFYQVRVGGLEGYMMRKYIDVVQGAL